MSVRYSKHLNLIVFISDLLLFNIALIISHFITFNTYQMQTTSVIFALLVNVTWVCISFVSKCFCVNRPLVLSDNINKFLLTLIYHLLIVFGIIYFFKIHDISRSEVIITYSLYFFLMLLQRSSLFFGLDYYRRKGYNHRQILIFGDEEIAARLVKSFSQHPEYGYDLADFISERQLADMPEESLIENILAKRPDEIFICYKLMNSELLKRLIRFGDENFIKIKVVSDLILSNNYAQLVNYDNLPVLHITSHPEISLKVRFLKRSFDIVFASFAIILGAPLFIILYFITKGTSHGPAFFKQERVGRNQEPFYIFKFRSMYIDAERHGPQLSKDNDSRITEWGLFMRRTRLDELPQFWNVLKGEMSIVGPRPERQHFIEKIVKENPNYKKLLRLKPGITSLGQVHYGYAQNIDEMRDRMRIDLIYFQNINLQADLNIIFKTVGVMIQRKGK